MLHWPHRWQDRLIVLIGLILIIDSLALVATLKINAGTILPAPIGLFLLSPILWPDRFAGFRQHRGFAGCWRTLQATGLLLLCGLFLYVGIASPSQSVRPAAAPEAIVVLGSGLRGDIPTPVLANRLDVAIQTAQAFPGAIVLVSGGNGSLETIAEADAMQHYLLAQHIPIGRIVRESRSTNTRENLVFCKTLLAQHGIDVARAPITIVTSDFHTLRALRLARKNGYAHAEMIPARTPLSILPNAWLRDYLAFIKAWISDEI